MWAFDDQKLKSICSLQMLKNEDLKKSRLQDKHFNVKYALSIYKFVLPFGEKFLKDAAAYLEKRKQNETKL